MVNDARGHVVPSGPEAPKRQAFLDLSDSIADVRPVASQDAADALVADLVAAGIEPAGTVCWIADLRVLAYYTGSAWQSLATGTQLGRLPYAAATGTATVTSVNAGATKSTTVTLPSGRFTKSPMIVTNAPTSSPSQRLSAALTGGSTTSFTLYAYNGTSDRRDIQANWIAMQD